VEPSLETTLDVDVQPLGKVAKKKPTSGTSSTLQTRTSKQKTAMVAANVRSVAAARPTTAAKPQPAKGTFIDLLSSKLSECISVVDILISSFCLSNMS